MNPGERLEFTNGVDITGKSISFTVNDGRFALVRNGIDASGQPRTSAPSPVPASKDLTDLKGLLVVPAAIDMHVHSRDPGFPEKETWQTLAAGAYKGGVTYVCDMPNTNPPVMGAAEIREKALRARESSLNFSLYLGASQSNMANLKALLTDSALPICGLKVYYGQSTGNLMFDDLESLAKLFPRESGKVLAFHSEDQCGIDRQMEEFLPLMKESGYRDYSFHSKVRSSDTALASTTTILDWALKHQLAIHIAHVSTPTEVRLIDSFRKKGLKVTTEVAPHHLLFSTDDYQDLGGMIKINPPVRCPRERDELCALLAEQMIEVFATDHAPHTLEEKQKPLNLCPSGAPALELYYPLLFLLGERLNLDPSYMLKLGTENPATILSLHDRGHIKDGYHADFVVIERRPSSIDKNTVVSKCGWSPYCGLTFPVTVKGTYLAGRKMYGQNL